MVRNICRRSLEVTEGIEAGKKGKEITRTAGKIPSGKCSCSIRLFFLAASTFPW